MQREECHAEAALHRGQREDAAYPRADRIREKDRRAGSARGQLHEPRKLGIAWVEYWNKLLYQGVLPHKLKEMCRIKISVAHQCGYCSTVRSNVAKAEGLTEDMINDLFADSGSKYFTPREKAALRYADLFKQGEYAIDKDEVYQDCRSISVTKRSSNSACSAPRWMASASS